MKQLTGRACAALLALVLAGSLFSCGRAEEKEQPVFRPVNEDGGTAEPAETEDGENGRTLRDDVPELDFGGAAFRAVTQDSCVEDIYAEELSGEVLNDAIFNRNMTVQNRFDILIPEPTLLPYSQIGVLVQSSVTAGDDAYELILGQMEDSGPVAMQGYFRNWYDLPYVDFEKPWYPESIMQEGITTINGRMYLAVGDMLLSYADKSYAMAFDQVYAEDYGITGVYDVVRSGDWTIDRLISWTENIYVDTNGNGTRDTNDFTVCPTVPRVAVLFHPCTRSASARSR